MTTTVIHLVRHAEVENPGNIWYGHLDGYPLSAQGRETAEALGELFASRPLTAVYASPLARAQETARPIARARGLDVEVCQDIIESQSHLQGEYADRRVLLKPRNLRYFVNPFRPTWGEPYRSVAARMVGALEAMQQAHPGEEVVAVSHMTPIQIARLAVEGRRLRPWLGHVACRRGSVTSLEFGDDGYERTRYQEVATASAPSSGERT
jgi:broad specificity phosphatase PhoE